MYTFKKGLVLSVFCICFIFSINASAHYMWLNVNDYTPDKDKTAMFTIGWGHHFYNPVEDLLNSDELLGDIFMIDPDGNKSEIKPLNIIQYESADKLSEGTWIAMVQRKEGFSTKTTDGYKRQSRKGLTNVVYSRYLGMYGKAIINVGHASGNDIVQKPVGAPLEIIPLTNPANTKEGDYFRFKVLYQGKPVAESFNATYVGFSTGTDFALTEKTDDKGEGKLKITKSGIWVIKANHKAPYPNKEDADEYSYTASLAFEIK